jgi:hypothetical protein
MRDVELRAQPVALTASIPSVAGSEVWRSQRCGVADSLTEPGLPPVRATRRRFYRLPPSITETEFATTQESLRAKRPDTSNIRPGDPQGSQASSRLPRRMEATTTAPEEPLAPAEVLGGAALVRNLTRRRGRNCWTSSAFAGRCSTSLADPDRQIPARRFRSLARRPTPASIGPGVDAPGYDGVSSTIKQRSTPADPRSPKEPVGHAAF